MTWRKLVGLGAGALCLFIIWQAYQVWSAAFLGVLFALSLNGPVEYLRQHIHLPGWLATSLVLLVAIILLSGLLWVIGAPLTAQFHIINKQLPATALKLSKWFDEQIGNPPDLPATLDSADLPFSVDESPEAGESNRDQPVPAPDPSVKRSSVEPTAADPIPKTESQPFELLSLMPELEFLLGFVASFVSATINVAMLLMLSLIVMLFVAFDPAVYQRGFLWLVPTPHEDIATQTMDRLCIAMRWWMAGRLASMVAVGLLTTVGMWSIGMPAPLALGAIAGLLSFVPNIGPLASAIPGILMASGINNSMMLWVAGVYLAAQLVESNVITPLVEQFVIAIPPGVLIVAQFVFLALGGLWGMIIATPCLVVVMVLVQQLYINRFLGKQIEVAGRGIASDYTAG